MSWGSYGIEWNWLPFPIIEPLGLWRENHVTLPLNSSSTQDMEQPSGKDHHTPTPCWIHFHVPFLFRPLVTFGPGDIVNLLFLDTILSHSHIGKEAISREQKYNKHISEGLMDVLRLLVRCILDGIAGPPLPFLPSVTFWLWGEWFWFIRGSRHNVLTYHRSSAIRPIKYWPSVQRLRLKNFSTDCLLALRA